LDPIWTLKTGSLFLLSVDAKELFLSEGLVCLVKDFDKLGAHETLGSITVPPKTIYNAKGERMEFKLESPPGKPVNFSGHLAIRCRRASDYDIKFMKSYAENMSEMKHEVDHLAAKGGSGNIASYFRRQARISKDTGHKEVRGLRSTDNMRWRLS
jgi:hypothetical protein